MASFKYKSGSSWVSLPDNDTTYSLSKEDNNIVLTGSDGSQTQVTDNDSNTKYSLSKSGNSIILTGSDGNSTQVQDNNWTDKLACWPIGSIYISSNATSPSSLFGGSWAALPDYKYLITGSNLNSTGGSTRISVGNLPSHNHRFNDTDWITYNGKADNSTDNVGFSRVPFGSYCFKSDPSFTFASVTGVNTGGGQDYWQPYYTIKAWRRTA